MKFDLAVIALLAAVATAIPSDSGLVVPDSSLENLVPGQVAYVDDNGKVVIVDESEVTLGNKTNDDPKELGTLDKRGCQVCRRNCGNYCSNWGTRCGIRWCSFCCGMRPV